MSKTYSAAPDVDTHIGNMLNLHHEALYGAEVTALFVFDLDSTKAVLKHQGYAAAAVVRIVPVKDRSLGMPDATITVDRTTWLTMSPRQRDALIDHELTHLVRVMEVDDEGNETDTPKCDVLGRPKLRMRLHDHQYGWFDEIAERHGDASIEVKQVRRILDHQLYFDFAAPPKAQAA